MYQRKRKRHAPARDSSPASRSSAAVAERGSAPRSASFGLPYHAGPGPGMSLAVQRAATVGDESDPLEREADEAAESIAERGTPPSVTAAEEEAESEGDPQAGGGRGGAGSAGGAGAVDDDEAPAVEGGESVERAEIAGEQPPQTARAPGARAAVAASAPAAAHRALATTAPGRPLSPGVRGRLESGFGVPLGGVRVHQGDEADLANESLGARAFAHRDSVWVRRNESPDDLRLMAHEVAHVLQQRRGRGTAPVRRTPPAAAPPAQTNPDLYDGPEGKIDEKAKKILIPELKIPSFKIGGRSAMPTSFLTLPKRTDRENKQTQDWEQGVREGAGLTSKLDSKLKKENSPKTTKSGQEIFYLKLKGPDSYVMGNRTAIRNRVIRPYWKPSGSTKLYDVDHIWEVQLGGPDRDLSNFWLLESGANQSSGRNIKSERDKKVRAVLDAAVPHLWASAPETTTAREDYEITVEKVAGGLAVSGETGTVYTPEEVRDEGKPLDGLKALTKTQIKAAGLAGSPDLLAIFSNPIGGKKTDIEWGEGVTQKAVSFEYGKNFRALSVSYDKNTGAGSLEGMAFAKKGNSTSIVPPTPMNFDLVESHAVDYGGYVSRTSVNNQARSLLKSLNLLSPLQIDQMDLDGDRGLFGTGKVSPTLPLIGGLGIELVIDGDSVRLEKTFSGGELTFPGPVQVTGSDLTLSIGSRGVGIAGNANFEVEKVGKGKVGADAKSGTGTGAGGSLSVGGEFEFDTRLFDEAKISVTYDTEKFSAAGKLTIGKDKVKGVKKASIDVTVDGDAWTAVGSVEPDVPGVKSGELGAAYSPDKGFEISGTLTLGEIPGIKGGELKAKVAQQGEGYSVSASGEAQLAIPGIDSGVDVSYEDGAFDAKASVGYEKGLLSGSVEAGVTNRAVEDGAPVGDPGETLTVYGGGSLTIKLAPWLQGTVGVKLLPNGEIEVTGKVELPSSLDVFPEKKVEKEILSVGIDIPIVGVAVAGQRIGIFVNISGSLGARAAIGPGQLRELGLSVTYNPSREEDTKVSGNASFVIPADAGLRLAISGSLGAGIPIVSASAGLEIGGELGIDGEARADVNVDWTPTTGLSIEAEGKIKAQPKFTFDITGFVKVEADLLVKTIELYEKRWQLASFEYGSDLAFGISFPVKYQEGEPFDLSLSDVEFEVPEVDPTSMLSGLIGQIT